MQILTEFDRNSPDFCAGVDAIIIRTGKTGRGDRRAGRQAKIWLTTKSVETWGGVHYRVPLGNWNF